MVDTSRFLYRHFLLLIVCALFFSGCAKKTTVVLLPDPSGKVGRVTVTTEGGSTEIDKAREATTIRDRTSAPSAPAVLSEEAINRQFADTLAHLPEQPKHFMLYFRIDSEELTPAAIDTIPKILAAIREKKSEDISVVGHTDTAGDRAYNFELSNKRARAVTKILEAKGVKPRFIKTTSHGENNPLIPTEDNVNEPRNRRVQVTVR